MESNMAENPNSSAESFPDTDNGVEKTASENNIPKEGTLVADNQQPEPQIINSLTPTKSRRIPIPGPIQFTSVKPDSVSLLWGPPNGLTNFRTKLKVTCRGQLHQDWVEITKFPSLIPDLIPGEEYGFTVATVGEDEQHSEWVSASTYTEIPAPEELKVELDENIVTWKKPKGLDQATYLVSFCKDECCLYTAKTEDTKYKLPDLDPKSMHKVRVSVALGNGSQGKVAEQCIHAVVPKPMNLKTVAVTPTSAHLKWSSPREMSQISPSFIVFYSIEGTEKKVTTTQCKTDILDLKPDTDYSFSIHTMFNERLSDYVTTTIHTKIPPVKFFTIVIGNTCNHHEPLRTMLINKGFGEVKNVESCDVILAFCVIVSRVGTDMDAALKQIPDSKPAVLVVMHHTFDPDHVTPNTSRFVRNKETVDILFHEDKGILSCSRNRQAENTMVEMVCDCAKLNSPGSSPQVKNNPSPTPKPPPAATYTKTDTPENSTTASSKEVKYCSIVSGNTLGADKDFKKCLTVKGVLLKEESSVEQCDFLLIFCPVVSLVGSDIEEALKHIPDDKPSILVVMHYTFEADYLPPDTRRYEKDNNMLIVDCLFYEDTGLLKCQRNDDALKDVTKWLHEKFPNVGKGDQREVTRKNES